MKVILLSLSLVSTLLLSGIQEDVTPAEAQTPPSAAGLIISDTHVKTHADKVPRFCNPPNVASVTTNLKSGNWSDPTLWPNGVLPGTDARVQIAPNTTVTYDVESSAELDCMEIQGSLVFATDRNTKLMISDLMVMPEGTLTVGTATQPIPENINAEIIFTDTPLEMGTVASPGLDPQQYGKGLIVFGGITMHGKQKDSFHRIAGELTKGTKTVTLVAPVSGWKVGDALVIPDTNQPNPPYLNELKNPGQWEEPVIESVNGATITLTAPLKYDHPCARDADAAALKDRTVTTLPNGQKLCGHMGNLSRNIILRSENPNGVRGHVIFFHRAQVNVRYVDFKEMGRTKSSKLNNTTFDATGQPTVVGTNQIGRYVFHLHHVWGKENPAPNTYQFEVVGNVMRNAPKWCIAIHGSSFGLVKDNIAYNCIGAGIVTEDGNEINNVIEHNFAVRMESVPDEGRDNIMSLTDFGWDGAGFWFHGSKNYLRNNVAANSAVAGFQVIQTQTAGALGVTALKIPKHPGADMTNAANYTLAHAEFLLPLDHSNNEAYGARGRTCSHCWYKTADGNGLEFWKANPINTYIDKDAEDAWYGYKIKKPILWNNYAKAVEIGVGVHSRVAIEDAIVRAWVDPNFQCCAAGITPNPAYTDFLYVTRANIQGAYVGVSATTLFELVEDSYLRNILNINAVGATHIQHEYRNNKYEAIPGMPLKAIDYNYRDLLWLQGGLFVDISWALNRVLVYDYQGNPNADFALFAPMQDPNNIMLHSIPWPDDPLFRLNTNVNSRTSVACPEKGITNKACFEKYGLALMGVPAPCADKTTHPEINGIFCPLSADPAPLFGRTGPVKLMMELH